MDNHYISLENREKITISQVLDVDAFDEDTLWANLKDGAIGLLIVTGKICSFAYTDKKIKEKGKLFRLPGKR